MTNNIHYVNDNTPGITRQRVGKGFSYRDAEGHLIRDAATKARIAALGIPPAWRDVWICPDAQGHIQATGRDARGRKQYRYHTDWQAARDANKYGRMVAFGEALPAIRAQVEQDLAQPDLSRAKVLATVVRLLETTLIRVGNQEYARTNESYGLTTMLDEHVTINGATLRFDFRGKSGKDHEVQVRDRRLARIVQRCQELPGQHLFQYLDDEGNGHAVGSADVNAYLREITGEDFTAKDFRTWAGTVLAAETLHAIGPCNSTSEAKRNISQAIRHVASRLGNTPTVCRKSYVYPMVLEAYLAGSLIIDFQQCSTQPCARQQPVEAQMLAWIGQSIENRK
jgi:DNA topoisomerase I